MSSPIRRLLFFVSLAAVLSSGCARDNKKKEDDVILSAYRLIDADRDDEAIVLLEGKLDKGENAQYQAVLASAYAHKAGIKVQKLIPAVKLAGKIPDVVKPKAEKKKTKEGAETDLLAEQGSSILMMSSVFLEVFKAIPSVTADGSVYLKHAIYLLDGLGNRQHKRDAVYRAVLNIVLLKRTITEEFVAKIASGKKSGNCSVDVSHLNATLASVGSILVDIFTDVAYVDGKQKKAMLAAIDQTTAAVTSLSQASSDVSSTNSAYALLLKKSTIDAGFGKLLTCDEE
jgi:hypothetical protein